VDIADTAFIGITVSLGILSQENVQIMKPDRSAHFNYLFSGLTAIERIPTPTTIPTFTPTPTFTSTVTPTPTNTFTGTNTPTPTKVPDVVGPLALNCEAESKNPLTISEGTSLVMTAAVIDDSTTGQSRITGAEFFVNTVSVSGTGEQMIPVDPAFDSQVESVAMVVDTSAWNVGESPYQIWIHGVDEFNNWGNYCQVEVIVVSPTPTPFPPIIPVLSSRLSLVMIFVISLMAWMMSFSRIFK